MAPALKEHSKITVPNRGRQFVQAQMLDLILMIVLVQVSYSVTPMRPGKATIR